MAHEPRRGHDRDPSLNAQQIHCVQNRNDAEDDNEHGHDNDKRNKPILLAARKDTVEKYLTKRRVDDADNRNDRRRQHDKRNRRAHPLEPLAGKHERIGLASSFFECLIWLENKHDAREALLEILEGDLHLALRRIVDDGVFALETGENHEVIEVPKQDAGILVPLLDAFQREREALCRHAVGSCGFEDIGRL